MASSKGLQPIATLPVDLTAVYDLTSSDKPFLATGHYNGSVVYVVQETDEHGLRVQTFTVDGGASIELRAVSR